MSDRFGIFAKKIGLWHYTLLFGFFWGWKSAWGRTVEC